MENQILNDGETLSRLEQLSIMGGNSSTPNNPLPTYPVYPPMPV